LVCLVANAVTLLLIPAGSTAERIVAYATTALGGGLAVLFVLRVFHHLRHVGDRVDLNLLARGFVRARFDPELQTRRYGAFRRRGGEAR